MISFIQLTFVEIGFQDNKQKATKTIEFESTSKFFSQALLSIFLDFIFYCFVSSNSIFLTDLIKSSDSTLIKEDPL